jgi:hypothetical protein
MGALALPAVLWLPAAAALLAPLLLSGTERQVLVQRLLRPRLWRTA